MALENSDNAPEHDWMYLVEGDPHEQPGPMEVLAAALVARLPPMLVGPVASDSPSLAAAGPGPVVGAVGAPPAPATTKATTTPAPWLTTEQAATRLGIARKTLDEMVKRAPRGLPGSPVPVGEGEKHRFLRWDPERLPEWAEAYRTARKRSKKK